MGQTLAPAEQELRAYLLGRLPEAEAERLEETLLEDEEIFAAMLSAEDDLFDEVALGRLSEADRAAFLARYRGPDARSRVAVAQALAARRNVVPFWRRPAFLAAAAALVVIIGGLMSWRRPSPATTPVATVAPPAPPRVTAHAALIVSATVTLGGSRAAGGAQVIELPNAAETLALKIALHPEDRFEHYAAELRATNGSPVWSGQDLQRTGDDVLTPVPAAALPAGSYELAVRGRNGATAEDLGFVALEVRRTP